MDHVHVTVIVTPTDPSVYCLFSTIVDMFTQAFWSTYIIVIEDIYCIETKHVGKEWQGNIL